MVSDSAAETSVQNIAQAQTILIIMIVIIVFCLAASLFLGTYISRLIGLPLAGISAAAGKLAAGDIDVNVKANSEDEIGQLADAFNQLIFSTKEQAQTTEKIASGDHCKSKNQIGQRCIGESPR
jgi:methyl-accepting chemotaxis protein